MTTPHENDFAQAQSRFWHGGDAARTVAFDAFSLMFPAAEAFMIRGARAAHDRVDNPSLRREIAGFVRQEAAHARLHGAYNRAMEARGFDAIGQEARNGEIIAFLESRIGLRRTLAASAGLEHFTALIAQRIIEDDALLARAEPHYRALWLWHAREELEHKAVAFDVHASLYPKGLWLSRTRAMVTALLILLTLYWWNVWRLAGDIAEQPRWRTIAGVLWFTLASPGLFSRIVLPTLAYFLPGFHPDGLNRDGGKAAHLGGGEDRLGERPGAGGLQISHGAA
ncbi:MAG: metal-dependent hydrolase [Hyphomonadaceae bacterium]|nr:metal-dependent hydrolase [Hyphomonadaceae bacterium]